MLITNGVQRVRRHPELLAVKPSTANAQRAPNLEGLRFDVVKNCVVRFEEVMRELDKRETVHLGVANEVFLVPWPAEQFAERPERDERAILVKLDSLTPRVDHI